MAARCRISTAWCTRGSRRSRASFTGAAALLADCFQLRDGLQVLRATGRALDVDERVEIQAATLHPEHANDHGAGREVVEASPAHDLAEQVEVPQVGVQGEVQPLPDGPCVPAKR